MIFSKGKWQGCVPTKFTSFGTDTISSLWYYSGTSSSYSTSYSTTGARAGATGVSSSATGASSSATGRPCATLIYIIDCAIYII